MASQHCQNRSRRSVSMSGFDVVLLPRVCALTLILGTHLGRVLGKTLDTIKQPAIRVDRRVLCCNISQESLVDPAMMLAGHCLVRVSGFGLKSDCSPLKSLCGRFLWILSRRSRAKSTRRRGCPGATCGNARHFVRLQDRIRTGGVGPKVFAMEMKAIRSGRVPPRNVQELTEPGDEKVGVLLAEAVQKVARLVARELLRCRSLFENEAVERERIRGLSRVVRSCVKSRAGKAGATLECVHV